MIIIHVQDVIEKQRTVCHQTGSQYILVVIVVKNIVMLVVKVVEQSAQSVVLLAILTMIRFMPSKYRHKK